MVYAQDISKWDNLLAEETTSMYDLERRLLDFSVRAIRLTRKIRPSQAGMHIAKQLLRSSTFPLANHGEAQAAKSPRDFIQKLRVSLKGLRETERWIKLTKTVPLVERPELLDELLGETDQLIRIFVTSIKTAEARARKTE